MTYKSIKPKEPYPGYVPDEEIVQSVVMSLSTDEATGKTIVNRIYSPTMFPPLTITTNNVSRKIDVLFVSTEAEEKERMCTTF